MSAYYNDSDRSAAMWLRELIKAGHIAPGDVDERSIVDVRPGDLRGYTPCHFFAGIGGWSHALRLAGWPDDRPVWTGSCPCQPFSAAGKQRGEADERHLWPEFRRLIAECNPPTVFGEQVASRLGREWLAGVRADLEALGYAVGAADLCAAGVGAPHIRQRLYWMADAVSARRTERRPGTGNGQVAGRGGAGGLEHAKSQRPERTEGARRQTRSGTQHAGDSSRLGDADLARPQGRDDGPNESGRADQRLVGPASEPGFWSGHDILPCTDGKARRIEPGSFPLAHGIPGRVGLLRGYGNAIVPQVAAAFIRACGG